MVGMTTADPGDGLSNYPTAAKSSSCPWSAVCIITTCGKLPEAEPTTDPPGQRIIRSAPAARHFGLLSLHLSFAGRHTSQGDTAENQGPQFNHDGVSATHTQVLDGEAGTQPFIPLPLAVKAQAQGL